MSTRRPRTRLGRIALIVGLSFVVLVTIAAVAGGGESTPTVDEAVATVSAPSTSAGATEPATAAATSPPDDATALSATTTTTFASAPPTTVTSPRPDGTPDDAAAPSATTTTTFASAPPTTVTSPRPDGTPAPTTTTATIRGPPVADAPAAGAAASEAEGDLVRDLLAQLRVEPERPAGYDRALFPHWITTGGCTTRAHVLIRDARGTAVVEDNCRVTAGQWHSAFDDVYLTNPRSIDIDHFVPLAEAWRSGADTWDAATRRRFANDLDDPRTLIAVTASSNRSKGDKDPADWLPTHTAYRCTYVGTWVGIKHRWNLAVDTRERSAIEQVLNGCGDLRTSASAPPATPGTAPAAPSTTTAPSAPASPTPTTTPTTATTIPGTTTTIPAGQCVNINTASLADLQRIVHIGSGRAEEIISMRPFSSVRDLTRINGIGPSRLADIEAQGLACT